MDAIQENNPRSLDNEEQNFKHNNAGLVPETYWRFCPSRKRKQNGDYHKVFNGLNDLKGLKERLLPNLLVPSVIIMDNTAYHRTLPLDTPSPASMKKVECIEYLERVGAPYSFDMSVVELRT